MKKKKINLIFILCFSVLVITLLFTSCSDPSDFIALYNGAHIYYTDASSANEVTVDNQQATNVLYLYVDPDDNPTSYAREDVLGSNSLLGGNYCVIEDIPTEDVTFTIQFSRAATWEIEIQDQAISGNHTLTISTQASFSVIGENGEIPNAISDFEHKGIKYVATFE